MNKLKENYGPFKDYDTYKRALLNWSNGAKENNDKYYEEFEGDIIEAVSQVLADYYMSHGCKYMGSQVLKILEEAFKELEGPFTFADLLDCEDEEIDTRDYYGERIENQKKFYKEKLNERSNFSKDIERLLKNN